MALVAFLAMVAFWPSMSSSVGINTMSPSLQINLLQWWFVSFPVALVTLSCLTLHPQKQPVALVASYDAASPKRQSTCSVDGSVSGQHFGFAFSSSIWWHCLLWCHIPPKKSTCGVASLWCLVPQKQSTCSIRDLVPYFQWPSLMPHPDLLCHVPKKSSCGIVDFGSAFPAACNVPPCFNAVSPKKSTSRVSGLWHHIPKETNQPAVLAIWFHISSSLLQCCIPSKIINL